MMRATLLLVLVSGCAAPSPTGDRPATLASLPPPRVDLETPRLAEQGVPPTRLGAELLLARPLVAVVLTESVSPAGPGAEVVRVRRLETLHDPRGVAGDQLTVLAYPGHFRPGDRGLVYLLPFQDGGRFQPLQLVDGRDPDWTSKLQVTRAVLALEGVTDIGRREAATVGLLTSWLESLDDWTRGYALAELRWLARHQPRLLSPSRMARLAGVAADSPHPDVQRGVESVARTLAAVARALPNTPEQESFRP